MITSIQGTLASSSPLGAVVEVGGFGYEVHMPATSAGRLPRPGATLKLHTLVIYREDAQTLYGFSSPEERDFFRLLIENVTGVGPKMALSIMSRLALPSLEAAIRAGDINALARCPGIGKKTAERLVVELRTKVGGGASPRLRRGSRPKPAWLPLRFVTPSRLWWRWATSPPTPTRRFEGLPSRWERTPTPPRSSGAR